MRVLILGGTVFLGRHLVEAALARGDDVTLFNRGRTNPELFPDVERLTGDRDGGLDALRGREWDAVVDPSGYVPRIVRASAELLSDAAGHYTFVSSGSVYPHPTPPGADENASLARMADPTIETVDPETYGPLKVLCEEAAEAAFPGRALHVRAGLIVGPYDPSDRFTYWPLRVHRGGEVLAPVADAPVQIVHARDLADWMLRCAENETAGAFNACGPEEPLTFGALLDACREETRSDAAFVRPTAEFLAEHDVAPWTGLPLTLGPDDGMCRVDNRKAVAEGLTFRPLRRTVRETLDWALTRDTATPLRIGIDAAREAEVLAAWRDLSR